MEREHQEKLVKIQTTRVQNEKVMQTFCEFGRSKIDSSDQAKTPTRLSTPSQIKSVANTKWVSSIRECASIEGDGSDARCNEKSDIPTLIFQKVKKQRLNQTQVETTQNNHQYAKPPKEPPPESYAKKT